MILDYPNERMILEETSSTNEPFEADMSGLRITPFADTWIIKEVAPATPGAKSGFRPGDVVHSLDGVPAEQFSYQKLHRWLRRDGAAGELCVDRHGTTACKEIRLHRRI